MRRTPPRAPSKTLKLTILAGFLVLLFFTSLCLGRYPAPGYTGFARLMSDDMSRTIVLNLRLPRVIAAMILGMVLASAGSVFQVIFNNPLVEPGFLGVSQGAAFGAMLAILIGGRNLPLIQLLSAGAGLAGLGAAYFLARRIRFGGWLLRLILSGLAISALFSSGIGLMKYLADPLTQLPEMTFWLLGSLSSVTWRSLLSMLPAAVICLPLLITFRWRINVLSLSEQTSHSLGVNPRPFRLVIIIIATLPVTAVISVSGIVQWLGLIIPHLSRKVFGADNRYTLPGSLLMGGLFGLLCDNFSRVPFSGEIPLGIIVSFSGALLFLIILTRKERVHE